MRNYLIGTAMVAGTALLVLAGSARAAVPTPGTMAYLPSAILCDTLDQVKAIVKVATDSKGKDTINKYLEFQEQKDAKGEPACNGQPVMGHVADVVDLGLSFGLNGIPVHAWAIHIVNPSAEAYALFGEAVEPKTSSVEKPKPVGSFGWDQWNWRRTWQVIAW
jgi:hypothetical protein